MNKSTAPPLQSSILCAIIIVVAHNGATVGGVMTNGNIIGIGIGAVLGGFMCPIIDFAVFGLDNFNAN